MIEFSSSTTQQTLIPELHWVDRKRTIFPLPRRKHQWFLFWKRRRLFFRFLWKTHTLTFGRRKSRIWGPNWDHIKTLTKYSNSVFRYILLNFSNQSFLPIQRSQIQILGPKSGFDPLIWFWPFEEPNLKFWTQIGIDIKNRIEFSKSNTSKPLFRYLVQFLQQSQMGLFEELTFG